MTDEELLMYQLRNPPVMSMALNKDHLYSMMHERMSLAADRIEGLIKKNNNLIELAMDEHKRAETTEYRLTKQIEALERELESVYEGVGGV